MTLSTKTMENKEIGCENRRWVASESSRASFLAEPRGFLDSRWWPISQFPDDAAVHTLKSRMRRRRAEVDMMASLTMSMLGSSATGMEDVEAMGKKDAARNSKH